MEKPPLQIYPCTNSTFTREAPLSSTDARPLANYSDGTTPFFVIASLLSAILCIRKYPLTEGVFIDVIESLQFFRDGGYDRGKCVHHTVIENLQQLFIGPRRGLLGSKIVEH